MIDETTEQIIANAINNLLANDVLRFQLQQNSIIARKTLHWQNETIKLKQFWKNIFTS